MKPAVITEDVVVIINIYLYLDVVEVSLVSLSLSLSHYLSPSLSLTFSLRKLLSQSCERFCLVLA